MTPDTMSGVTHCGGNRPKQGENVEPSLAPKPPLDVLGYARVSTEDQAKDGLSLEEQEARIREHCRSKGHHLVEVLVERGASGKSLRRPVMRQLLARLDQSKGLTPDPIGGVVVTKLDRLTRSLRDWIALVDRYFAPGAGFALDVTYGAIDLGTAQGRMIATMLVVFGQFERELAEERTQAIVSRKLDSGKRHGTIPYGWRMPEAGDVLIPCPDELRAIALALALKADGRSLSEIAGYLSANGFPTRKGRPWAKSTIAEILKPKVT